MPIESPLIDELVSAADLKGRRASFLDSLRGRLGPAPEDIAALVGVVRSVQVLSDALGMSWQFAGWDDVYKWLVEHGAVGQAE